MSLFIVSVAVLFLSATDAEAQGSGDVLTFEEVCALSTTVNCWGFESTEDMYYTWPQGTSCDNDSFLQNHPNGRNPFGLNHQTLGNVIARVDTLDGDCVYPQRDSTHSASGSFSLKIRQPSRSYEYAGGSFMPVFKRFGSSSDNYRFARFGPGGEFWVRFALRNNEAILDTVYEASGRGPGSNNGGIKRLIVHGHESSENLEETIADLWHRRVPQMYSNSGHEHYGVQDHRGCYETDNDPASYPEPPCTRFIANQWRIYQLHVIVGTSAGNDGLVELYVDDEQDPIIRVTDADHSSATGPAYTESAVWDGVSNGYGKMSFTFYATNKDPNQEHPEGVAWYDDVVVSTVRVPPLNTVSPPRPRPPTDVVVD